MGARILIVGMVPELVDFTPFPGLTAEKVRAGLDAQMQLLRDQGFEPVGCLVDRGETAEQVLRTALEAASYDVVVIGAGLRLPPPLLPLFERLINVVHAHAPGAKIAFNTAPTDTVEAALRWVAAPANT